MGEVPSPQGPLEQALGEVGDRWTLLVVATLLDGPRRFGDIERALPGIASNVLSDRLRRLERSGLALAEPYSERPPRYVYDLSSAGRELAGALRMLADWGARRHEDAEPARHRDCGADLEVRWYCPTCERTVEDGDADDLQLA